MNAAWAQSGGVNGMLVHVRLFARQRELAGTGRVDLDLPADATVEVAWSALAARHPGLASGREYVRFARNGAYAEADDRLADGDELACIPPVAGGSGAADAASGPGRQDGSASSDAMGGRVRSILLTADPIDEATVARLRAAVAVSADGAVVTFEGRTRETPGRPAPGEETEAARHAGASVRALEYEAYEAMTLRILEAVADEIEARFGVCRVVILHRTGRVPLGQVSVVVMAAAPHRDRAFDACRYAIDELKRRAPIWKAEQFEDGSVWIGQPARSSPRGTLRR